MRRFIRAGLLAGLIAVPACTTSSSVDCTDTATCQPALDGSTADAGDGGGRDARADSATDGAVESGVDAGPTCDLSADPKDSPACVASAYGLFVSNTTGADSNDGSQVHPLATIGKALSLATKSRIYVCGGTYPEAVTITAAVGVFGGFACTDWTYKGASTRVAPTAVGAALTVMSVATAVAVEDLEFDALAGTTAAPSSVAAFVNASPLVTMKRVTLAAGNGAPGSVGGAGAAGVPTPSDPSGNTAPSLTAGGPAKTCTCSTGGSTTGGAGGDGTNGGQGGTGTPAQNPPTPATATGIGSNTAQCSGSNLNGANGSNAVPPSGADGPGATVGTVDAQGWHPGGGQPGTSGAPGQGGGGGGPNVPGSGGGGGCGGCGGGGGSAGGPGGGSIALLAMNSPVQLVACNLTAHDGGGGGTGGAGAAGQSGGGGGNRTGTACNGGNGGKGSSGGAGGGGAGGVSIGILYQGTAPTADGPTQIATGNAGAKGVGGNPGVNDGKPGAKANTQDATLL